jgi:DNA replication protein DnaC
LFGKLFKNKIPIQYGIPSPVYTGLFSKYKDTLKDFKNRCILILGASGTGKTFTVQQEAQKTYLVYICPISDEVMGYDFREIILKCQYETKKMMFKTITKFINKMSNLCLCFAILRLFRL